MKRVCYVGLVTVVCGCYQYVPVGRTVPQSGREVRAHLATARDLDVGTLTVRDVTSIEGTVFSSTPDTLSVWGSWLHSQIGTRFEARGAVFAMDRTGLRVVEVRKLHPAKSIVALAAGIGLGIGLFTFVADAGADPGVLPPEGVEASLRR